MPKPDEKIKVKEIVEKYLKDNGYSGLCGDECGCEIDGLMPCEQEGIENCQAGHKVKCDDTCEHERFYDVGDQDWHIQLDKPKSEVK